MDVVFVHGLCDPCHNLMDDMTGDERTHVVCGMHTVRVVAALFASGSLVATLLPMT